MSNDITPKPVACELTVAEETESRKKAQADLLIPDPDDAEEIVKKLAKALNEDSPRND